MMVTPMMRGENEGADRGDHRDHQQRVEAGEPVPDQGETIHPVPS